MEGLVLLTHIKVAKNEDLLELSWQKMNFNDGRQIDLANQVAENETQEVTYYTPGTKGKTLDVYNFATS